MAAEIPDGAFLVARAILNSSLWTMSPTDRVLAITLIGVVNWRPKKWWDGKQEITIERGQTVRSIRKLATEAGLSYQETRTSFQHLLNIGFLTQKSTQSYTVITLPKYSKYQDLARYADLEWPRELTQIPTHDQRTPNAALTHDQRTPNAKQEGEERKEREEREEEDSCLSRLFMLSLKTTKIAGREDTVRRYLGAWIARAGGAKVEQILMDPWARGKSVIEIQEHFFPLEKSNSINQIIEYAKRGGEKNAD